jgi:hypothetical protein
MDPSKPSTYTEDVWLWAHNPLDGGSVGATGKWLIFAGVNYVDLIWARVKACTEAGVLGCSVRSNEF